MLKVFMFATFVFISSAVYARNYHYNCQFEKNTGTTEAARKAAEVTHARWEFGFALVLNDGEVLKLRKLSPYAANNRERYYDGVGSNGLDLRHQELCV